MTRPPLSSHRTCPSWATEPDKQPKPEVTVPTATIDNHPDGSQALDGTASGTTVGPANESQANSHVTVTQPSTVVFPPAAPSNLSVPQPTPSSGHMQSIYIHPDVNQSTGIIGDANQDQPIKYELARILCRSGNPDQLRREIHHMITNDRIEAKTIHNVILHMSRNPHYTPKKRISFRTHANIGAILRTRINESVSPPQFRPTNLDVEYYALDLGIRYEYLINGSRDEYLSFVEIAKMGGTLLADLASILETVTDYQARRNLRAISHHWNYFVHLILNDRMMLQEDNLISLLRQIDPSLAPVDDPSESATHTERTSSDQADSSHHHPQEENDVPKSAKNSSTSRKARKIKARTRPRTTSVNLKIDGRTKAAKLSKREAEAREAAINLLSLSDPAIGTHQEDSSVAPSRPIDEYKCQHGAQTAADNEKNAAISPSARFLHRPALKQDNEVTPSINKSGLPSLSARTDVEVEPPTSKHSAVLEQKPLKIQMLYPEPRWWKYDTAAPVDKVDSGISSAPSRPSMTPHDTSRKGLEGIRQTRSNYRDRAEEANSDQEREDVVTRDISRPSWSARTSYLTPMKREADAYTDEVLDGVVKKLRVMEKRDE